VEVGRRLSEARQRRNLALSDIARSTKIPLHFLEAIERDDVDRLPPDFFARAFVRTYATHVGVDPGELLDSVTQPENAEPDPNLRPMPSSARAPISMRPLLLAMPVAACALYYIAFAPAGTPPGTPRVAVETPIATADRIESAASAVSPAASDVELQIQSSGGCIVAATADGRAIASQAMQTGEPVVLKARGEVVLRVGDSSSCAPAVTPVALPKVGRRSQVDADQRSTRAVAPAVDEKAVAAPDVVEHVPAASDAALPPPDPPAASPASDQF
jgi:cytoskeletal protein RodZ